MDGAHAMAVIEGVQVQTPQDTAAALRQCQRETGSVLLWLDASLRVLATAELVLDAGEIENRRALAREALDLKAEAAVLATFAAEPSISTTETHVAKQTKQLLAALDMRFVDHLIVTRHAYVSANEAHR